MSKNVSKKTTKPKKTVKSKPIKNEENYPFKDDDDSDSSSGNEELNAPDSYYNILGVNKHATLSEIKKNYKELVMKYHPDKIEEDDDDGNEMIKKINEAYETLKDDKRRNIYDTFGKNAPSFLFESNNARGVNPFSGFPQNQSNFNGGPPEGFEQMFEEMLRKHQPPQQINIRPITISVSLTLEEIYSGKDWTGDVIRFSLCKECNGYGTQDKEMHKCNRCHGNGTTYNIRHISPGNIQQIQTKCNDCNGTGKDNSFESCDECGGDGTYPEKVTHTHTIDPGAKMGDIIIIDDMGHQLGKKNGQPVQERGEVHLKIYEKEHPLYKRGIYINGICKNEDLTLHLEIDLHDALCGFTKEITFLDGTKFYIDNKEIIKDGDIRIIKDKGLPDKMYFNKGDLYIIFKVRYPNSLTLAAKSKIYELLTKQKYSHAKIHKIPKNSENIPLEIIPNLINYNFKNEKEEDDYDPNDGCATQ